MRQRIALVTGASSGIGRDAAQALAQAGFHVFAAARRLERLEELRGPDIEPLELDVVDPVAVKTAVARVLDRSGGIDFLLNNAGVGLYGSVESTSAEDVARIFAVNLFGAGEVLRSVVPVMRRQGSGRIANMSSVAGRASSALLGWYAASKHGLEAVTHALRQELRPFGVWVSLIEPGAIATEFATVAVEPYVRDPHEPDAYLGMARAFGELLTRSYERASGPQVVTRAVLHAATARWPRRCYVVTATAKAAIATVRYLGYPVYDRGVAGVVLRER